MGWRYGSECKFIRSSGTLQRRASNFSRMTPSKPKAVVLVSGGMDSCVCAAIAGQTQRLAFLHASYGQRTEKRERKSFDEIAEFYKVDERLVVRLDHFRAIGGSALTDERIA